MGFSTTHLIIFLVIVVVLFGTKKLRNIGSDLGGAVKGFKDGMKTTETEKTAEPGTGPMQQVTTTAAAPASKDTIDVETKTKV